MAATGSSQKAGEHCGGGGVTTIAVHGVSVITVRLFSQQGHVQHMYVCMHPRVCMAWTVSDQHPISIRSAKRLNQYFKSYATPSHPTPLLNCQFITTTQCQQPRDNEQTRPRCSTPHRTTCCMSTNSLRRLRNSGAFRPAPGTAMSCVHTTVSFDSSTARLTC